MRGVPLARTPSPAHTAKLGGWSTPSCRVCGRRPESSRAWPDRRANHASSGQEDHLLPPDPKMGHTACAPRIRAPE